MLGSQFEAELNASKRSADVGEEVKVALKRLLSGRRPSLGDVARTLGLSSRTLQRRLDGKRPTFQQLLQETRRDLAHHYLRTEPPGVEGNRLPARLRRCQLLLPRLSALGRNLSTPLAVSASTRICRTARRAGLMASITGLVRS